MYAQIAMTSCGVIDANDRYGMNASRMTPSAPKPVVTAAAKSDADQPASATLLMSAGSGTPGGRPAIGPPVRSLPWHPTQLSDTRYSP